MKKSFFYRLLATTILLAGPVVAQADSMEGPYRAPPPPSGYYDESNASGADYGDDMHGREEWHHHHQTPVLDYDTGVTDTSVMYQGHWSGTMTGSWNGGPVHTWTGSYDYNDGKPHWEGRYVPNAQTGYDMHGSDGDRDHMGYHEHFEEHGAPYGYREGYAAHSYGAYYGGRVFYSDVLVPSAPIITRTVTTRSYYVDVPVRTVHYVNVVHHIWHPAACSCQVHHYTKPAPHRIQGS